MNDTDAQARALFERSVERLDPATANRLRLARRAALAQNGAQRTRLRAWPPLLAASAVLLLGLAWWLPQRLNPAPEPSASVDGAVLVEEGDDAELYAWLAEAPVATDAPAPERAL